MALWKAGASPASRPNISSNMQAPIAPQKLIWEVCGGCRRGECPVRSMFSRNTAKDIPLIPAIIVSTILSVEFWLSISLGRAPMWFS